MLLKVTLGYTVLHGATTHRVTWGLHKATQLGLHGGMVHRVTWEYTGLHNATQGYLKLYRFT